ncbi:uncharacterized protein DSM5745_06578 [Aspergillus mulundensis]|uniref:Uncharacterized protein n=1 Tax=Aspergillus mulundensis TaxID=1810919 RepID=A0A3D8RRK7_9EURO|nr:hypothetical protein DSM5745_06578 [Aspergillus mulundensis]RDW76586.1 hypothetical protein DSM5745_06578 [Aspergillus mulundensis]
MSESEFQRGVLPAAEVAKILNAARVPNILFGWKLTSLSLILETAVRALIDNGFNYCDDAQCVELKLHRWWKRFEQNTPYPVTDIAALCAWNNVHEKADAHFHIKEKQFPGPKFTVVSLFKQSRVLWSLPTLTLDPVAPDDPTFILTNDTARLPPLTADRVKSPSGPWTDVSPVKTLTNTALVEAVLWLVLRCLRYKNHDIENYWHRMFHWLFLASIEGERQRALRDTLKPEFEPLIDKYQDESKAETPTEYLKRLLPQLIAKGKV